MDWPNNSLPKSDFTADRTLIAPGMQVTFTSMASQNTETVEWTFEGGEPAASTETAPVVTYAEAGVYRVTMKAANAEGEAEKIQGGFIVVDDAAQGDLALLSQGQPTEATAFVNSNEARGIRGRWRCDQEMVCDGHASSRNHRGFGRG